MTNYTSKRRAASLPELGVVLFIIGILLAVAMVGWKTVSARSEARTAELELRTLTDAVWSAASGTGDPTVREAYILDAAPAGSTMIAGGDADLPEEISYAFTAERLVLSKRLASGQCATAISVRGIFDGVMLGESVLCAANHHL